MNAQAEALAARTKMLQLHQMSVGICGLHSEPLTELHLPARGYCGTLD